MPGLAAESDFKPLFVGRAFNFSALLGAKIMEDPLNSKAGNAGGKETNCSKVDVGSFGKQILISSQTI